MSTKAALETVWHVPVVLWSRIAPILGPEKQPGTRGRPAVPYRQIFDAIIYVLRTGCQWSALPRERFGAAPTTVHGRFRQWAEARLFEQIYRVMLEHYDEELGIDWKWLSLDGCITKAPLGGEQTGKSPVDRGKLGTKRSVLTDGRGVPLSVVIAGANCHDKTIAIQTIDEMLAERPEKRIYRLHHLCLDKGYDYRDVIAGVLERDFIMHLKKRGVKEEDAIHGGKRYPARRWVVERTNAWHNKFRRLLIRWERKFEHYLALVDLASTLIIHRVLAAA
jgi:putative transposase